MKQAERDDLQVQQVRTLGRVADALEAPAAAEKDQALSAVLPPMRRLFGGERGAVALLRGIPGWAALWERVVPEGYVREVPDRAGLKWSIVSCPCGEHPSMRPGALAECFCDRWYFSTGRSIRVKRFELEAAA